jgi:hypothetical protein
MTKLEDFGLMNDFVNRTLIVQETRARINTDEWTKLKDFGTSKKQ